MLNEIEQLNAALAEPEVEGALSAWREGRMAQLNDMRDAAEQAASKHGVGEVVYALLSRIRGAQGEAFQKLAPLVESTTEFSSLAVFEHGLGLAALGRGAELAPYIQKLEGEAPILALILKMEHAVGSNDAEQGLAFAEAALNDMDSDIPQVYRVLVTEGVCFLRNVFALIDAEQFRSAQQATGAWGSRHVVHLPKPGWTHSVLTGISAERISFLNEVSRIDPAKLVELESVVSSYVAGVGASNYVLFDSVSHGIIPYLGLDEKGLEEPIFWSMNPVIHAAYLRVHDYRPALQSGRLKLFFEDVEGLPEFLIQAFAQIKPKDLRLGARTADIENLVSTLTERLPHTCVSSSWTDLLAKRPEIESYWRQSNRAKRVIDLCIPMDTVYIKYAMEDLRQCLVDQGYEVRTIPLDFPGVVANLSFGMIADRFSKAEPADLTILANFTVSEAISLPDWIHSLTWMQDPSIFEGWKKQDDKSWMLGFFTDVGEFTGTFQSDRVIPTYMPVYDKPFRQSADQSATELRHVVSLVSNIPSSSAQVFDLNDSGEHYPRFVKLVEEFKRRIDDGAWGASDIECRSFREYHRVSRGYGPKLIELLNRISNALRRKAIARTCLNTDLDLEIYGNGWSDDKEFEPYAKGHLVDRKKLSNVFCSSAINIDPGGYVYFHPRQSECAFSGGFILYLNVYPGWGMKEMLETSEKILRCNDVEQLKAIYDEMSPDGLVEWRRLLDRNIDNLYASQCLAKRQLSLGEGMDVDAVDRCFERISFSAPHELQEKIAYFTKHRDEREALAHEFAVYCERHGNMARIFNQAFDRIFSA